MRLHPVAGGMMAVAAGLALGPAARAAAPPVPGIYDEYQYVISSSSAPPGLTSCHPVGTILGGYVSYPGPAKPGAASSGAIESGSIMHMQVCTYPATPVAGATVWSGTASCTNTYQSGPPNTYSLTFDWKFTFVSKNAWLAQKTLTYPVTGGTCTEVRNTGLQRTGK